jgi:type II secretory pathway pseudopilin PulG
MNSDAFPRRAGNAETRAFSRTDLVAVVGVVGLLSLFLLPVLARETDDSERAVCLNNMQRIMAAVAMYSTDNSDFLPHPSWGSDLSGPDNWCYATANRGRDPELPVNALATSLANCAGRNETSIQFSNQVRFFKIGQLARFLESRHVLVCPTDWRESMSSKRFEYLGRPQKLSSYDMNGTVGGYVGPGGNQLVGGATYKTTDFLPTDILLWEQNEIAVPGWPPGFAFNDAASNPETGGEGLSRRHAAANGEGMAVVGRAGATADFVKWRTFNNFLVSPRPNDLLCGPGYRR